MSDYGRYFSSGAPAYDGGLYSRAAAPPTSYYNYSRDTTPGAGLRTCFPNRSVTSLLGLAPLVHRVVHRMEAERERERMAVWPVAQRRPAVSNFFSYSPARPCTSALGSGVVAAPRLGRRASWTSCCCTRAVVAVARAMADDANSRFRSLRSPVSLSPCLSLSSCSNLNTAGAAREELGGTFVCVCRAPHHAALPPPDSRARACGCSSHLCHRGFAVDHYGADKHEDAHRAS